jgi:hypothetical protein
MSVLPPFTYPTLRHVSYMVIIVFRYLQHVPYLTKQNLTHVHCCSSFILRGPRRLRATTTCGLRSNLLLPEDPHFGECRLSLRSNWSSVAVPTVTPCKTRGDTSDHDASKSPRHWVKLHNGGVHAPRSASPTVISIYLILLPIQCNICI